MSRLERAAPLVTLWVALVMGLGLFLAGVNFLLERRGVVQRVLGSRAPAVERFLDGVKELTEQKIE